MGTEHAAKGPGTSCSLTVSWWAGELPAEGDFIRTRAGSCYRIDEVVAGRSRPLSRLRCTRLERDAVAEGEPGVFMWEWKRR